MRSKLYHYSEPTRPQVVAHLLHVRCGFLDLETRFHVKSKHADLIFLRLRTKSIRVQYIIPSHQILSGLELPVSPSISISLPLCRSRAFRRNREYSCFCAIVHLLSPCDRASSLAHCVVSAELKSQKRVSEMTTAAVFNAVPAKQSSCSVR